MKAIAHILNRLTVLYAAYTEQGWKYTVVEVYRKRGEIRLGEQCDGFSPEEWKGRKHKFPVILVLGGRGIVTKEYATGSEAIQRITAHPQEFLFALEDITENRQQLTFLRREQYDNLMTELSTYKLPVIAVRIDPAGDMAAEARTAANEFFGHTLAGKNLIKPLPENNTLFGLLTSRLLLPVLGLVLSALVVNFFVQQNLQQQVEQQQVVLAGFQRITSQQNEQQGRQQELQGMLAAGPRYPSGWMADRIAAVIPAGVTLTELTVQPVQKKLQDNKPLLIESGRILIRGESASASPVTRLTDTLGRLEMNRSVQLLSLTRDRNNRYQFEIDLRL